MRYILSVLIILTFLVLAACNQPGASHQKGSIIAEAGGRFLYQSEINYNYKQQLEYTDSIEFVNIFINSWIEQQLLVAEAERQLTPEELDIEYEIEKYKQELIIHKYRTKRIERLKEAVEYEEIEEFFNENTDLFILKHTIAQVSYIIFPIEIEVPLSIKNTLQSDKEEQIVKNEEFIFSYAKKFDQFENSWIYIDNLLRSVNIEINNIDRYLQQNKLITFETENEQHFISIKDYKLPGENAPIGFVAPQIKAFILNSQKLDFLREIKDSLYNDALKYNKFRVYNK